MDKSLWKTEIIGVGFVAACSSAMLRLYDFCEGQALGILFGAVNNSAWERCKTLLLPYLVWGLLELLCVRVAVYRFTVAKTAGLYFLGALCLPLGDLLPAAPCAALSVCASFLLSFFLYRSRLTLRPLFAPAVCFLFLFVAVYVCFTPFPPQNPWFRDAVTGLYGIPPTNAG